MDGVEEPAWIRPQALMLSFCGGQLWGRDEIVFSGSFVDVLARVGVGEHAARSTLARMTRRGLLARYRIGKRVFFGLTKTAEDILADGERKAWREGPVNREWHGRWTLLGFSLPETRRADRHLLRSRLSWAGFGLLRNGLWVCPAPIDVTELLADLDVVGHVKAFEATTLAPTDVDEMIADAWDLDAIAARYRAFLTRWDVEDPLPGAPDDLARHLLLITEWLLVVREDPRLPVEHLPADWPAVRAEHVVLRLRKRFEPEMSRIVESIVERLPTPAG
ncbi:PaaX family transcriptional regulator [Amycolatopsis pigmentata]|uniref:PaaX family transcriptional regulator C-terminal domain-containing protein n=1 Tax=Amycolatopsis pigmentata TaxID=450801 RepID=A0ABW5G4V0_9PSEU